MSTSQEAEPVILENAVGDEQTTLAPSDMASVTSRATELLALSHSPRWLGAVVELGSGSIDYSLEGHTRDH